MHVPTGWKSMLELNFGSPKANLTTSGQNGIGTKAPIHILSGSFNKFLCKWLLKVEQVAMTTKGAVRPFSTGGMLPWKNLKFRSSEMQFPSFWVSKRALFMMIFIDQ